jgi:endonuclease/exonuclease/phosphatase (EEP) superfamily protein YafD
VRARGHFWARFLAWGVCAGALCVGLAGQFGRWSDRADVLNFAAPVWAGAGILAALILLLTARRGLPSYVACAIVLIFGTLLLSLSAPSPRIMADACPRFPLRLIQFNVFKDNPDAHAALAWIKGSDTDIVVLEEAVSRLSLVDELRAEYPYAAACAADLRCSTVILSRRPFLATGALAHGDAANRKALSAAWVTLASPLGPFTVVAAHLSRPWPWRVNPSERSQLAAFVRTQSAETTLVAGDFNLPSGTFQLKKLATSFRLAVAPNVRSWPATWAWPASWRWPPIWGIDHLFVGSRWAIEDISRGPFLGSDHYPLLAKLELHGACSR